MFVIQRMKPLLVFRGVRIVYIVRFLCLHVFSPMLSDFYVFTFLVPCCPIFMSSRFQFHVVRFPRKTIFYPIQFVGVSCFIYVICIYLRSLCVLTITRQVPLLEQEMLTLTDHSRSPQDLSGIRVARSSISCLVF